MEDEKFRNDSVTITREEMTEVIGVKIARFIKHLESEEDKDEELVTLLSNTLMAFSGDILTTIFDEGKIDNFEIQETAE